MANNIDQVPNLFIPCLHLIYLLYMLTYQTCCLQTKHIMF